MKHSNWIGGGLISMALAVGIGAFGAHFFEARISDHYMDVYKTAVLYQFIHSLGLVIVLMYLDVKNITSSKWINWTFLIGLICFCGSLYIISFNEMLDMPGLRKFGAIAPIGGLSFVAAWVLSALNIWSIK